MVFLWLFGQPKPKGKTLKEKITIEVLEALKSEKGGYTKETLTLLGIPWPPPKGWKKKLFKGYGVQPKRRKKRRVQKAKKAKSKSFYSSYEWANVRYKALQQSDGRCCACGRSAKTGAIMHVDHIKPLRSYPELRSQLSNLQVLCATCNWGKGNKDETDWREPSLKVLMSEAME